MNFWFISIFESTPVDDNPNTRFNALVREALRRGHSVTFWGSTFKHNEKRQRFDHTTRIDKEKGLRLRFLKSLSYSRNVSLRRLYSHRRYAADLIREFDNVNERPDLILFAFPPLSSAERIAWWAKKNGIPCVMDIIDPWPDAFKGHVPVLPGWALSLLIKPMQWSLSRTLELVDGVTAISEEYIEWAKRYSEKLENTRCFYPAVEFEEMQEELRMASGRVGNGEQPFRVIYAGSFGHSYDIETMLEAASAVEERCGRNIMFTMAGDGPKRYLVEEYCRHHKNLEYIGRVAKKDLMEYYCRADIGMTQHVKGATQSVTYKLFDLLACGIPIMNSLESEMKTIILDKRVGLHNDPGDSNGLAENILYCFQNPEEMANMKQRAVETAKENGDSRMVYSNAADFLESVSMKRMPSQLSQI